MTPPIARPYTAADHPACLALFDSNVPQYFAPSERHDFDSWLQSLPRSDRPYLVMSQNGTDIACGGLMLDPAAGQATMVWGMVDRRLHRQGVGTVLTRARIDLALACPGITRLHLSTSQHSTAFYQRFGFVTTRIVPDGFAAGLDQYDMTLPLSAA
ncbi:GNAT family N-acetyltransferase [Pseudotabrizicola sp. 4114]|uniref:GNAT family N-acetyltransferase n=1 Tax=Pseudotabrizicola sp. 4114 TaxID=2817731 RepID=UPI0028612636|nr:ribosomal protein S18 acetylase RimI-like enzyme [Pseudorhodobacter sp. 4114]